MRRAPGLIELSRRDFCELACVGAALAACSDGTGAIQTGALGPGGDDTGAPDAPDGQNPDGGIGPGVDAHVGTDAGTQQGVACTGTPIDVGPASTFLANKPIYNSTGKFFVVRDSGGLYAVTAKCTHEGAVMTVSGPHYFCPRHGATFQFDGTIISGPVSQPLVHYAMCNMSNGNIGVETTMTVSKTQRLVA
jgi:nitrite reductase/ring-hydroxylating ferredoxin subunit